MQLKKKMAWLILLVAALPLLWVLLSVDDWRRDLTTNHARTDAAGADPRLRPLRSQQSPAAQAERIAAWVDSQSNWSRESEQRTEAPARGRGSEEPEEVIRMHLVRRTRWLRFRDDIYVTLTPTAEGGSLLEATSQSRIGKGDLGQNPRNLRELLDALSRER